MRKRNQIIWGSILGIIVIIAAWRIFIPSQSGVSFEQNPANQGISVHITGAVKNPGLINLPVDARMSDALAVAELAEEADSQVINLAQKLRDGQKIYIPFKGETGEVMIDEAGTDEGNSSPTGTTESKPKGKININKASSSQLQGIPGIGPVLAERIIAYRQENGMFMSIEDLQNVKGIGPKSFEKIAEYVTVGP